MDQVVDQPYPMTFFFHGTVNGIFTHPWMVDFDGINVGKYTSPMDPTGYDNSDEHETFFHLWIR